MSSDVVGPSSSAEYGPPLTQGVVSPPLTQSDDLTSTQSSASSLPIGTDVPLGVSIQGTPEPHMMVNDTDLVYAPGSSRLALSKQHALLQIVIQGSFDILRCSLLSINAFPDGDLTTWFIKDALLRSAKRHLPGAKAIHQQLLEDPVYFKKISRLVSPTNVFLPL